MLHNIKDTLELVITIQKILEQAIKTTDIIEKNLLIDDAKYVIMLVNNELNGENKMNTRDRKSTRLTPVTSRSRMPSSA